MDPTSLYKLVSLPDCCIYNHCIVNHMVRLPVHIVRYPVYRGAAWLTPSAIPHPYTWATPCPMLPRL